VVVVGRPEHAQKRYFDEFQLLAGVLSDGDRRIIQGKRAVYRAQQSCTCVLMIREDRQNVTVDLRTDDGWKSQELRAGDELALPAFGLVCRAGDLYRRTNIR
jgi:hypothetical protein